jgi:TPR repeat protein
MAANPFKPLIVGTFIMLAVTTGVIIVDLVLDAKAEQERRHAENQKRYAEESARRQREFEQREAEARQRREKQAEERRLAAEASAKAEKERREAAEAAAKAEQVKRRPIDVTAAFTKKLHQAQAGDPNAQHLIGYIYYLGMDRIVETSGNGLAIYRRTVVTMLIGEDPEIRPLVSAPTFKRNDEVAAKWFERAALQGHRGAQTYLGITNAGRGKYDLAYLWMLIADGPALPDEINLPLPPVAARNSMKDNFRKKLTPEQVAEAEKKAKEFKAKKEEG